MTVKLPKSGREFYAIRVTTTTSAGDPIGADAWKLSLDGGTTKLDPDVQTDETGDWSCWLLAGPTAPLGSAVARVGASIRPHVSCEDGLELIVAETAPRITIV